MVVYKFYLNTNIIKTLVLLCLCVILIDFFEKIHKFILFLVSADYFKLITVTYPGILGFFRDPGIVFHHHNVPTLLCPYIYGIHSVKDKIIKNFVKKYSHFPYNLIKTNILF